MPTDPFGVRFDCATQRRVLVRVRAVAHAAPNLYREEQFEKTKASLQQVRFAVSSACRED